MESVLMACTALWGNCICRTWNISMHMLHGSTAWQ